MKQLVLIMIALMIFRRRLLNILDHVDQLIKSSYLANLDAHFDGYTLGNNGRVAKQIVFAFLRVLRYKNQYDDLVVFLATILDRKSPLLHFLDELVDQYLIWKIEGQTHKIAFKTIMEKMS